MYFLRQKNIPFIHLCILTKESGRNDSMREENIGHFIFIRFRFYPSVSVCIQPYKLINSKFCRIQQKRMRCEKSVAKIGGSALV